MADRTDDEMLDQDLDQPATRRDLRAFEASLREEMRAGDAALRAELRGELRARDQRFESIDQRFESIDQRFESIDQRFDRIDQRFERIDQRFERIDQRFERIDQRFDELRSHFDAVAESFRAEFRNLYDWTLATTSSLGSRLDHVEKDHGTRLLSVETRVTRLERRRKSNGR